MLELEEKSIAHYTIQHRLARGGMSNIYLAYDEDTQRTVAVKVVHRSEGDHWERFQREIKVLHGLKHEHILPIIEYGEHGSWYYCVMPYIEGGTLRERIKKRPLTEEEAGAIFEQVASALQCAHEHGILHRDIKPSNILLQEDDDGYHAYLADFGLAKEVEQRSDITQTGCLLGTPEYMAPELAEEPPTTSSDIYALGMLIYQMFTGQVPFKGNSPLAIYWKHIHEQPVPPSLLNANISSPAEQVVLCALEKEPKHRFRSVQGMAQAYARALQTSRQIKTLALLSGVTLANPTQRVIPAPTGGMRLPVHPAVITLIALLLFMIPVSLGLSVYTSGLSTQTPIALGASAQFAQHAYMPQEFPPIKIPVITPTQTSGHQVHGNSNSGQNHGTDNGGQNGDGNNQHQHKHKHGHGHGGDN